MAIPDFQTIMLPLLKHLSDAKEHPNQETVDALSKEFQLSEEERTRLIPSGQQSVFTNRIAWAKAHFKRAGLIEAVKLGVYRITSLGQDVLKKSPVRIDLKFLDQFPGHREFRSGPKKQRDSQQPTTSSDTAMTPQEHIAHGHQLIQDQLADEILKKIKSCTSVFFEQLVIDLLLAMGYGGSREDAGKTVGRSGDGGIDGIINEDRLGLDTIYIQAKRWDSSVSRPEVQKFAGALQGQRAKKGIFITTSSFTREAHDFAKGIDSKIILIDGNELADLMITHGVGVTQIASYHVKRLDSDYFEQE